MAFLRFMRKNGKHTKLEPGEKKCLAKDLEGEPSSVMADAVAFKVKYLGSTVVSNNTTTTAAVDTILSIAKAAKHKRKKVTIMVTLNGIMVSDFFTGNLILDASVYRIPNCSTDPARSNIFTFFAINKDEITECHAFQCQKRKMAETVTLTVANSFRIAYEAWQRGQQVYSQLLTKQITDSKNLKSRPPSNHSDVPLIDFSDVGDSSVNCSSKWVRFDNDKEDFSIVTSSRDAFLLPPPKNLNGSTLSKTSEHFTDESAWT